MKLLTIVVTAYNEEKYIERCIESLENNLGKFKDNVEIIISNNNSTDKTLEISEMLQKKYSNVEICNSIKQGPSVARNVGINSSNGEFITFIDGDDYVDENLEEIINIVEKNKDIDLFQLTFKVHKNNEIINPAPCKKEVYNKELDFKEFIKYLNLDTCFSSSSTKIIKTSIIKENNLLYNENNMQMEDAEFSVKVWENAKKFMFLNNAYYHYETRHEGSLTTKISLKRMLQGLDSSINSVKYILEHSKNKKLLQFTSLMTYSLIRRYKDLSDSEKTAFLKVLNENKIVLAYPYYFSTKLFYIVAKIFGLRFALKFV